MPGASQAVPSRTPSDPSIVLSTSHAADDSWVGISGDSTCEAVFGSLQYADYRGQPARAGFNIPAIDALYPHYRSRFRVPANAPPGRIAVVVIQGCGGGDMVNSVDLAIDKAPTHGHLSRTTSKPGKK